MVKALKKSLSFGFGIHHEPCIANAVVKCHYQHHHHVACSVLDDAVFTSMFQA